MNKKLSIALIIIVALLVIAAAVSRPLWIGAPLIVVWVFLVWAVRKRKAGIFGQRIGPERAERLLKRLKLLLRVGGISLAVGIAGVILHNAIYAVNDIEEVFSFFFGFVGLVVFIIATVGSLVILLTGQLKTQQSNTEIKAT